MPDARNTPLNSKISSALSKVGSAALPLFLWSFQGSTAGQKINITRVRSPSKSRKKKYGFSLRTIHHYLMGAALKYQTKTQEALLKTHSVFFLARKRRSKVMFCKYPI